ncbi:tetratricopeptide repeat protein [Aquincola tertiaricarbonis]|uniref:tetratricopeptide repeat protein n=1 Tax=Aquincola tertiaricarbonis TaxID=391953 RepID=UPI000698BDD8|nr:tetratricopeptide repeat protein [Aquincola tertiaricarbonis]
MNTPAAGTPAALEAARGLFLEGVARFEAGHAAEAAERFEAALALAPGRVSVLINLGAARLKLGQREAALQALDTALAAEPQHADGWTHRGLAAGELGRHAEALGNFERALALDPGSGVAQFYRALCLGHLQRHAEALAALERLLQHQPQRAPAWMLHGQTLQQLQRHAEALPSYRRAVAVDPTLGAAWSHLGQLLKDLGRRDEAAAALRRAIDEGDDADTNRYFLAALGVEAAPSVAPRAYVQALFDGYADDFEPHLVQVLRYRAHEDVAADALAAWQAGQPAGAAPGWVIDLGCGTGLCGARLKPPAQHLEGVDLSHTMVEAARRRGVYDTLAQADITEHLQAGARHFDIAVAADTFIYLGDLGPVFAGVRHALRPGGVLAFSAEIAAAPEDGAEPPDYRLDSHMRYAHSEPYLRRLAAAHGFAVVNLVRRVLREEQRRPVMGWIVALRIEMAAKAEQ